MNANWEISIIYDTKIPKNVKKAPLFVPYMTGGLFSLSIETIILMTLAQGQGFFSWIGCVIFDDADDGIGHGEV